MSWANVDAWAERQRRRERALQLELDRMDWVLVKTNDGIWGACRWGNIPEDEVDWPDTMEPEARGATPEILLATVRAFHAEDERAMAALERWACQACGHKHEGAALGNICVGCHCQAGRPERTRAEQRA